MSGFNFQDLANTAWAFSTVCRFDAPLFAALASVARQQHMDGIGAQHIANTAWAYANACHSDAPLLALLARAAEQHIGKFSR